jgi:signal transduction histidine kinase
MRPPPPREIASRMSPEPRDLDRLIVDAAESERTRLAQALHNTVCQSLSGIHLMARLLCRKMQSREAPEAAEMEELAGFLDKAIEELHSLEQGLRPFPLHRAGGIEPFLSELARDTSRSVPCELHCPDSLPTVDPYVAMQLCRIAKTAVEHAVRHGNPRQILLSLVRHGEEGTLAVQVKGGRFPAESDGDAGSDLGLLRRRASVIGASLSFESEAGLSCRFRMADGGKPAREFSAR